jgi:hypothetical protein
MGRMYGDTQVMIYTKDRKSYVAVMMVNAIPRIGDSVIVNRVESRVVKVTYLYDGPVNECGNHCVELQVERVSESPSKELQTKTQAEYAGWPAYWSNPPAKEK